MLQGDTVMAVAFHSSYGTCVFKSRITNNLEATQSRKRVNQEINYTFKRHKQN